ncbi:MAG: dihydrolipoyl dehydrogenase [Candidatus Zixiibacteriota bacterium]|nr:MAG: dihydrolipoyl dehydrogenase [candidate division Zixibacteria bacterium]
MDESNIDPAEEGDEEIENYDIVIIGGGPGGYTAAIRAAMKGASVAVVESRELGGVCLNRGCIPSKALIASASEYHRMKRAGDYGIRLSEPPIYDWLAMRARKDKIVALMVGGIGQLFKSHGVKHFNGFGKIVDGNHVLVTDDDNRETRIKGANIIIATGSRALSIPSVPIDGHRVVTSDHMFEAENLPESILIIGAGVIGCEWACMMALLDVEVSMVEMLDRALPMEDAGVSRLIERELKKLKVSLYTGTKVDSIGPGPQGLQAQLSNGKTVEAGQALVAVGRAFNTGEMGLDRAGVVLNRNGSIMTDSRMRTNIENIYAIGDVRGEILLAYTAVHDGAVAVDNCLGEKSAKDYAGVPSVIFTYPEVASVGLTEDVAAKDFDVAIGKFPLRTLGKAHAENEIQGEVKVVGDKKTDRLLGVHIVGAHATEVIHTAALAIRHKLTVTQLGELIFGHPVISEAVMEAAHDLHGRSVHLARKRP